MGSFSRRKLLSGIAAGLGAAAAPADAQAPTVSVQCVGTRFDQFRRETFTIPFGPDGVMGEGANQEMSYTRLLGDAIVPPLSDLGIYAHGWLTDASELMLVYSVLAEGFGDAVRERRGVPIAGVSPPDALLAIVTHWPSRPPQGYTSVRSILAPASFSAMEVRANLVGSTGMARLMGIVWERLLADPRLASVRLNLIGHSFGCRLLCSALQILATQSPAQFRALQNRNPINLVLLQPAFPAGALEPNDLSRAHPYAQLVNYQNLRILTTWSEWDFALGRFYPGEEGQVPADLVYQEISPRERAAIPALGGVGPTDATWRAFNGGAPRKEISVGPGFGYADIVGKTEQRLTIANLTELHAAHYREDLDRPRSEMAPFGRPAALVREFEGYHTDVYGPEITRLEIGFIFASR